MPRYLDLGESALTVEFGDAIDPTIHARVLALDRALAAATPDGVLETQPTFRSLTIHYDPLTLSRADLIAAVEAAPPGAKAEAEGVLWTIPCCYDPAFGDDLPEVAGKLGLTSQAVVALHSGAEHRAYMYGFAPGVCYLGDGPQALTLPRRQSPRPPIPEGGVLIAAGMSLITTAPMPTGWWLIGRTPERLFALDRDPPFLLAVGDRVRFEPVDAETFAALERRATAGESVSRKTA